MVAVGRGHGTVGPGGGGVGLGASPEAAAGPGRSGVSSLSPRARPSEAAGSRGPRQPASESKFGDRDTERSHSAAAAPRACPIS
eukprot:318588-Hanusia_phi.AAC.1